MKNTFILVAAVGVGVVPCTAKVDRASNHYGIRSSKTRSASVDLNGDGKSESIRLVPASTSENESRYRLIVGGKAVSGKLSGSYGLSFYVVDINRSDRYKEVVVQQDGEDDTLACNVYWYDGRQLRLSGELSGSDAIFKGDGLVSQQAFQGFWTSTSAYRLNGTHRLVKLPRRYYPVNRKGTVSQSLPLHPQPHSSRVTATVKAGTKATVVKSDLKGWYFVQANTGAQGWVEEREIYSHIRDLPYAG